jgi:serine/threonine protein phosphatase PrpC
MSSIPKNKKSYNNINNYLKKLPIDRYNQNDLSKDNIKNKQRSIFLKSINSNSKDKLISKKLNNSSNNIKSNNSFNKIEKVIHKDTFNIKSKFYKNNHYNSKFRYLKNNIIHPNANNSVREKKIDIFNPNFKLNNSKNKDLNFSQNINVNALSPFLVKTKGNKSKEKNKFKKNEGHAESYRSKTPIIIKNIDNNPKSVNRNYNSSKTRKILNNNKHRSNLLYGANLNISNLIKKENNAFKNIRKEVFQSDNIFSQYKPKKKSRLLILKENLQLKQSLLTPLIIKEKVKNMDLNKNENSNYFIEIHPKIIQQKETEKLKTDKSGNEILPLTTNSTNMNILLNNNSTINNLKSSNSDMINSAVIKQQFNNSNNNSKVYINNDSNTHLNLNIYSSRSLNNNKNFMKDNINANTNETFNINKITSNGNISSEFKGKKIKCIHDISKTGLSGDEKKVNQDRDFIFHNFVSGFDNIFMGVCDGHGFFGHEISEFIKENLPMDLNRIIKSKKLDLNKDDLSKVLIETFKMENESLKRFKQIDSDLSGSTCVSVIYTPQKLIIANLGDSRCVLGTQVKNEWKYINLSRDHKPDIKEEADRIKKKGGRIRPMIDEDGNFVGPMRVYMKDKDMPGLAMTRSFGDNFASIAGTICEPEIKEHILVPEDKFIILASDGLFEFINSEEVGNIVKSYYEKNDIVGCCEYLYKESYRKWLCEEEDTVDDITIILVFFEDN